MKVEEFTADAFRPYVGTAFHVGEGDKNVDLELEEVKVMYEKHVSPRKLRDSFSLYFIGPNDVYLSQATFDVTHDELGGPWKIFIVPVGRRGDLFLYEAAFT